MKDWRREKDPYYWEAKRRGLRSRAYFKIKEIDKVFRIFSPGDTVIDIGSAPGGWLQYISDVIGYDGVVVGIDKKDIEEFPDKPNIKFLKGDIFANETLKKLREVLGDKKVDVIVSDASPDITGVYELDSVRIYEINRRVLYIARNFLRKGGILVIKTFQGREEGRIRGIMKRLFRFVKIYKPHASRKRSSEIYYIGFYFKDSDLRRSNNVS